MKYANMLLALPLMAASLFAFGETHNFIQVSYVEERPDGEDAAAVEASDGDVERPGVGVQHRVLRVIVEREVVRVEQLVRHNGRRR